MKILVIGATGTVGSKVTEALSVAHEIIKAGRSNDVLTIDINDPELIRAAFERLGKVDAVVCATGDVVFNSFESLSRDEWDVGINSRLMGQVNLTRIALDFLNDNGSVTLTSGIIADHPIEYGTSAATVNGAIQHFAAAVATELPRGIRINVVSPTVVSESLKMYGDYFPGFIDMPAADLAKFYVRSVLGVETGKTFRAHAHN